MDEEQVALIVAAVAQGFENVNAQITSLATSTDELSQAEEQAGQTAQAAAAGGFSGLQAAMVTLNAGMMIAQQTARGVSSAYQATVGDAVTLADSIQKLAIESGTTTEAASQMKIVFGDFGVQTDNLNSLIRALTKEGLAPNLDTIAAGRRLSECFRAQELRAKWRGPEPHPEPDA
jgi:hypothetical protein